MGVERYGHIYMYIGDSRDKDRAIRLENETDG